MVEIGTDDLTAVVDTNVLIDIFSCHDLNQLLMQLGEDGFLDRNAIYRRARARESLLLAIHLHSLGAKTYSVYEPARLMERIVDPEAVQSLETHFTTHVLHFVRDYILQNWEIRFPGEEDGQKGNAADAALLMFAKEHNIDLITNEGFTPAGIVDEKLRLMAKREGVQVFTPREYWEGKIDPDMVAIKFLEGFSCAAPKYCAQAENPNVAEDSLLMMQGYYEHILLGITKGFDKPVPVSLK